MAATRLVLLAAVVLGVSGSAGAQGNAPPPGAAAAMPDPLEYVVSDATPHALTSLDAVVTVTFAKGDTVELIRRAGANRLTLFLANWPVGVVDVTPVEAEGRNTGLQFRVKRSPENRSAWTTILEGRAGKLVPVRVGYEDKTWFASTAPGGVAIDVRPFSGWKTWATALFALFVVGTLTRLGTRTRMLRDSSDAQGNTCWTYSLSRTQMAFWFANVVVAFVMLMFIDGDVPTMSNTVLMLLGISIGTAGVSMAIDNSRAASAGTVLKPLLTPAEERALLRRPFFRDLASDGQGINLHRFQMVVWTVVMAVMFWAKVIGTFSWPDFDPLLLGLMGISSAGYVGLKATAEKASVREVAATPDTVPAEILAAEPAAPEKAAGKAAA